MLKSKIQAVKFKMNETDLKSIEKRIQNTQAEFQTIAPSSPNQKYYSGEND